MAHSFSKRDFMAGPGDRHGRPALHSPQPDTASFITSRETGDVFPDTTQNPAIVTQTSPFGKSWVHFLAGGVGGMTSAALTAPLDVLKTRLQSDFYQSQLRASRPAVALNPFSAAAFHLRDTLSILSSLDKTIVEKAGGAATRQYRNSIDCIRQVLGTEGIRGLYKGMSASYLGVTESTLQWMMYEQMKRYLKERNDKIIASGRDKTVWDTMVDWTGKIISAGGAKFVAAVIAYPHEVARTRLRQAPEANGRLKYTGLMQCFKLVWKEEGFMGLYGGLTPHLMRTVPSAAIMFGMYEGILRLFDVPSNEEE
ncbi:Endoglucanase-4 [Verticillium dahliae VDG1]|nr:Endoglucanase-4 [Verticillium dahliae VDG1]